LSGGRGTLPRVADARPTPKQYVGSAVGAHGEQALVAWVSGLLTGAIDPGAPDQPPLADLVGEPSARWLLEHPDRATQDYWARTWGARALLYAWDPSAAPAVVTGLGDRHWRVREMSAKVARAREVGEAAEALARLTRDDVRRVRLAAVRALAVVGEAEHADALRACHADPEPEVREAAEQALRALSRRLDREL
jgi:hypothetical protein